MFNFSLSIKVQNGFTANGLAKQGYDASVVNALLVGSGLTVALVASFTIIRAGTQVVGGILMFSGAEYPVELPGRWLGSWESLLCPKISVATSSLSNGLR
jgi:hypothetical protein